MRMRDFLHRCCFFEQCTSSLELNIIFLRLWSPIPKFFLPSRPLFTLLVIHKVGISRTIAAEKIKGHRPDPLTDSGR